MKTKEVRIGKHIVGEGHPVFIIAEAGVNHNGKLNLALQLVDAAKKAGADAVKFQTFDTDELVTTSAGMAAYQKRNTGKTESQYAMIRRLELSADEFKKIAAYCGKRGIVFLSTPHSGFGSVDLLQELDVPAFKFGSGDLDNLPVLDYAARFKKPMIISTGMADEKDVAEAVACIRKAGNDKIVVFQCTTDYPTKPEEINLRVINALAKKLNIVPGYSDHTEGMTASVAAVAMGARMLEKHLTLDTGMEGPDHKASLSPKDFAVYVREVRDTEAMMGSAKKIVSPSARGYMPLVLKSVVVRGGITKGEYFTKENLAIKRPRNGLPPKVYWDILGKRAMYNLAHDEPVRKGSYKK